MQNAWSSQAERRFCIVVRVYVHDVSPASSGDPCRQYTTKTCASGSWTSWRRRLACRLLSRGTWDFENSDCDRSIVDANVNCEAFSTAERQNPICEVQGESWPRGLCLGSSGTCKRYLSDLNAPILVKAFKRLGYRDTCACHVVLFPMPTADGFYARDRYRGSFF